MTFRSLSIAESQFSKTQQPKAILQAKAAADRRIPELMKFW
jgi:hypothetical protein